MICPAVRWTDDGDAEHFGRVLTFLPASGSLPDRAVVVTRSADKSLHGIIHVVPITALEELLASEFDDMEWWGDNP